MNISAINNITFGTSKKNGDEEKSKITDKNSESFKPSTALETPGRSQVIKMPPRKKVPESIGEVCDYYIGLNSSKIKKYETGELRPPLEYVSTDDIIGKYKKYNERLKLMKGLNDERFLKTFSPRYDYYDTSRNYIGSNELLEQNIEVLNSMDERIIPKIKAGGLIALLENKDLETRAAELAQAHDKILESADKAVIMDYLCDTNIFSRTRETIEYMQLLPNINEFPENIQDALINGKISINVEALRSAFGKQPGEIVNFPQDNNKK